MRVKVLASLVIPFVFLFGTAIVAEKDEAAKKAVCPISGKPVNSAVFLEVNGKKVEFCCENCPKAYKKKIGLVDEGPKTCPMSGQPAKAETGLIHRTAEMVYFCCENCPKQFAKKNNFEVKDAGPKKCPISGEDASADASLTVNGETTYFCCKNCLKKYSNELGVKQPKEGAELLCTVSGRPAKVETGQVLVKSKMVYFCCNNCRGKYIEKNFTAAAEKKEGAEKAAAAKKERES